MKFINLYASPNIIMEIKSRRMICAGRVPHMEEMRNAKKKFGQKT
jgi:hypothetical protein